MTDYQTVVDALKDAIKNCRPFCTETSVYDEADKYKKALTIMGQLKKDRKSILQGSIGATKRKADLLDKFMNGYRDEQN